MALNKHVRVARRFLKSVRIDSDLGTTASVDGFVCPRSFAMVVYTMARHVSESGHGAYTWTGPYGSGKSSLVAALSALLGGDKNLQKEAVKAFGRRLADIVAKSLPPGTKGWRVLPVVARRDNPVAVIGDAAKKAGLARQPRGGWSESALVAALTKAAAEKPKTHGGLVLFIDEMGKFLEAAARDGADIYVFQQLAEAASRCNGRFIVIGVLHQSFEEYGRRLSREMRDEWAKIQGRFIDLVVDASGDEQIELVSRAIENNRFLSKPGPAAAVVADFVRRGQDKSNGHLAATLESCWPLHPITACLLGPISRRRFGQNQRSVFGFLNSTERHGFQDFLAHAEAEDLYGPDRLWDYLRVNLEPSILASPDGHRWALATEALERCEAAGGDGLAVKLLKAIAVIDLFKEHSRIVATPGLLRHCFAGVSGKAVNDALSRLDKRSFTIFKKFQGAHAIYAGSDFDIEKTIESALGDIAEIDFAALRSLAGLQPILAKRHYHETGAMRWYDVDIAPVCRALDDVAKHESKNGAVGRFLLTIPTEGEDEDTAEKICREVARLGDTDHGDIVVGVSRRSWSVMPMARELLALERVSNNHPELAGDAVARREVVARLVELQGLLEVELHKALDSAVWLVKDRQKKRLRLTDLNMLASQLADERFSESPRLHNELLNRQRPSASAISAQNKLLHRMVANEGEPRLGIEGFPAEGGLFAALLDKTKLYKRQKGDYVFAGPGKDDCRLAPMWQAALEHVMARSNRTVPVSELFDLWRKPPYGVKNGLMPILAAAFILSLRDKLAVYRCGVFRTKFDALDVDYFIKDAADIQLRWMNLSDAARRLLSGMAQIVRDIDGGNALANLQPIDVGRGLVAIYDRLPKWTTRTMRLSANAMAIRDLFKKAQDPNKFLFDDIPGLLGEKTTLSGDEGLGPVVERVREGLEELVQAYPLALHRLRDAMFAELRVPNASPQSIAELRGRAENIKQLAGDFRLDAFAGRLSTFDGSDKEFEGIASLAVNKPPRDWVDAEFDRAAVEIAHMARKFVHAETVAHVKGRKDKRHAMAVVVGMDGRPLPLFEEFDIADTDRAEVDGLIRRITRELDDADTGQKNVILAALAEIISDYIKEMEPSSENRQGNKETA